MMVRGGKDPALEQWPTIRTELAAAVYEALPAAGMTLPFPQREVRILDDGARAG